MNTAKLRKYVIIIIPALYLVWSLQLNLLGGPFSLSRSDPEYPYLLNGLNCATLHFNNIGHTDHPGTPFQVVTGVFIRITHAFIGQGSVTEDVLSRPEMYLSAASLFLTIFTFFLLYWLGSIAMRHKGKLTGALILQSTLLLSTVLIDIPLRYNPDRILVLYILIFAGLTLNYLFSENYAVRKYAIWSGILMGIGFATKFNFLPILIIPLFLIPDYRNKIYYSLTTGVSFFVGILPIINKFREFRQFISGVASHDGLYGSGSEKIFNWKAFGHNFWELLSYNPAFTVVLILSIILLIIYSFAGEKSRSDRRLFLLPKAFIFASVIGFILVAKHFKVYYFAPVLSLSGLVLYTLWVISGDQMQWKKVQSISAILLVSVLVFVSVLPLPAQYRSRVSQKQANLKTQQFYSDHVTKKDLMFIEPTWMAGPMVENALVYGISYVAHREQFYQDLNRQYPQVITWEGPGKKPALFRTAETDPESLLFGGRDIYIYSSPGRNAELLVNYLDTLSGICGTRISREIVFTNPDNQDRVFRIRNEDGWKTLMDTKVIPELLTLNSVAPVSESIYINGVTAGDYIEITLLIRGNDPEARCRLIARSLESDQDGIYFEDSGSLQDIGRGWQLLRLRGKVNMTPAEGKLVCQAYYPGSKTTTIKDLQIRHMGRR